MKRKPVPVKEASIFLILWRIAVGAAMVLLAIVMSLVAVTLLIGAVKNLFT